MYLILYWNIICIELDLVLWIGFNIWKNVQEHQFSENLFSQVNDVGLSMYAVYVINKMILNYFIEN